MQAEPQLAKTIDSDNHKSNKSITSRTQQNFDVPKYPHDSETLAKQELFDETALVTGNSTQ